MNYSLKRLGKERPLGMHHKHAENVGKWDQHLHEFYAGTEAIIKGRERERKGVV
jgi:hypothetical protein